VLPVQPQQPVDVASRDARSGDGDPHGGRASIDEADLERVTDVNCELRGG
jgi:hypothetical protein